ncbi:aminopeptidase, partial [Shewanella sp. 0m-11]
MLKQWDNNHDYHSFANTEQVRVKHLSLLLDVDFDTKQLAGQVELQLDYIDKQTSELWLDTRDLTIEGIYSDSQQALAFTLDKQDEILGQRLNIQLS